ncbi:MAG: polysaccharide lyase 8 family protein [Candidatus Symbiothrix sp.]|jgi:chondroitin AC lyase|nr:polysaccharide lyase 8 family protein [Candidatus Symbiothrix sp.]
MKKFILCTLFVLAICMSDCVADGSDFEYIMQQIRQYEWQNTTVSANDATASGYLSSMQTNGSWSDIDYANTAQTDWLPLTHLNRLKPIVLAYTDSRSAHYGSNAVYTKIVAALQYWHDQNPISTNWYNQQIASPQRLGLMLILMRSGAEQIPANLENLILTRIQTDGGRPDQSGSQGTGANKIDIATHWVYRACLQENATDLTFGVQQVYYPLFFVKYADIGTSGGGMREDFSYQQHGPQFYTGGYGLSFIGGIANIAMATKGTQYALNASQENILSNFAKEYLRIIRGKYFMYNVLGRGLSRSGALNQTSFLTVLSKLKVLDSNNLALYEDAEKRISQSVPAGDGFTPQFTQYYCSDYALYTCPEYSFDVRSVSTRTYRNENGNDENLKGYYLADGATCITVTGDEYSEIFPVWDWDMIPGTTAPKDHPIPLPPQWGIGSAGKTSFVGGVSDTLCGVSVYDMNEPDYNIQLSAKKAWFFFGKEIVCLGAGITSTNSNVINTTVNQCLLNGNVVLTRNQQDSTIAKGAHSFTGDNLRIFHSNIGYVFPQNTTIQLSNQAQTGSWKAINTSGSATTVSKDVFKLWIEHDSQPTLAKYAYIVVPGLTANDFQAYDASSVEILSNNDTLQVVHHKDLNIWSMVFHRAAVFECSEFALRTMLPCVLMMKQNADNSYTMHVADPSQGSTNFPVRTRIPASASWVTTTVRVDEDKVNAGISHVYTLETANRIDNINSSDKIVATQYFNLMGQHILHPQQPGIYIAKHTSASGKTKTVKIVRE